MADALTRRGTISTAIGIIMERYGLDEERSFDYLCRLSQNSNVRVRDLAAAILRSVRRRRDVDKPLAG